MDEPVFCALRETINEHQVAAIPIDWSQQAARPLVG